MPEPLVFWDIDGTISSTSMESLFRRHLIKHRHIRRWQLPFKYASLLPSSRGKLHRIKLAYMKGMTIDEGDKHMDECFERDILPQLFPACTKAIARIKDAGIKQVLLSGTPLGLAKRLGSYLDIDDIIAAIPEAIDNRYTGRLTKPHPYSTQKAKQVQDWLKQNNYHWSQTVAIADNIPDKFLLQKVTLPIVMNPRQAMREHAQINFWDIIDDQSNDTNSDTIIELVLKMRNQST